jgi:acyl-coenzyme A synthetase/AMP-(fatty) acid ligase
LFITGDLARVDADGFIYIVDRSRDFLKCMSNRIGPKEIEEVIAEHPGVVEAAVIGPEADPVRRDHPGADPALRCRPAAL